MKFIIGSDNSNLKEKIEIDELSDKEPKIIKIVKNSSYSLILNFISVLYTLVWALLFTSYIELDENAELYSNSLKTWCRVVYIILYAFVAVIMLFCYYQYMKKNSIE